MFASAGRPIVHSHFLLFAALFKDNQGQEGARKREADTEPRDFDDDFSSESESESGSSTNDSSSDESMGKKPAASTPGSAKKKGGTAPAPAPAAGAAAGASTAEAKVDQMKFLLERFKAIQIADGGKRGFNFKANFPYIWYTFVRDGLEFIRYEFLVWSPHDGDYDPIISADGKKLYFNTKVCDTFLNQLHVSTQYHATPSFHNDGRANNPCFQAAKNQFDDVKSFFDLDDIKPMVEVKLPFQVHPNFICPYNPDMSRSLQQFPHEETPRNPVWTTQDEQDAHAACPVCQGGFKAQKKINVYICSMQNIAVARQQATTTTASHDALA